MPGHASLATATVFMVKRCFLFLPGVPASPSLFPQPPSPSSSRPTLPAHSKVGKNKVSSACKTPPPACLPQPLPLPKMFHSHLPPPMQGGKMFTPPTKENALGVGVVGVGARGQGGSSSTSPPAPWGISHSGGWAILGRGRQKCHSLLSHCHGTEIEKAD